MSWVADIDLIYLDICGMCWRGIKVFTPTADSSEESFDGFPTLPLRLLRAIHAPGKEQDFSHARTEPIRRHYDA